MYGIIQDNSSMYSITKNSSNELFHFMAEMSLANLMAKGYIKSSSIESGVILSYRMSITAPTIHVLSHTQPIWDPESNLPFTFNPIYPITG